MNLKQNKQIWMVEAVIALLALYESLYATLADFNLAITNIKDLLEVIWLKDNEKKQATEGKTVKKNLLDSNLVKIFVKVSSGLFLWGRKNNNVEIQTLCNISKSGFDQLRDAEKINKAKAVASAGTGKDLTGQNVSAAEVTLLDTTADEFKGCITEISSGAAKRMGLGQSIDELIDSAKDIVELELDKYMNTFETSHPEFFKGYKAARVIIDRGVRHGEEEEGPTPEPTPSPVPNP